MEKYLYGPMKMFFVELFIGNKETGVNGIILNFNKLNMWFITYQQNESRSWTQSP
jgi:hypothetical protein